MRTLAKSSAKIVTALFVIILIVWSVIPIIWNFLTSIKVRTDIFTYPPKIFFTPTWEYFKLALGTTSASVYPNLLNTIIVALGTMLVSVTVATLAAYAFSRYKFPGREQLMFTVLATRLLPPICAVIPLFIMFNGLKLIDTYLGLVLIYSALNVPFSIWMLKSFFDAVPKDLEESAQVEGCTPLQALWHVTFPLTAPGLAATAVFILVQAWNEFMFAFIFSSIDARTLPVLIAQNRGEDQFFWQNMAAQASILMLPPLIMGLFMQRYIVKGMTAGAVK